MMHSIPPHITHQPLLPTGQSDLRGPFDDDLQSKFSKVAENGNTKIIFAMVYNVTVKKFSLL